LPVRRMLRQLDPREALVLRLRFGLADGIEHTQDETARILGCCRRTVHSIEQHALSHLRAAIAQAADDNLLAA
jgi:DNA-directed RNA polymerase sigma subunit (sigma70/sigma32)